jgi:hypothetical protein
MMRANWNLMALVAGALLIGCGEDSIPRPAPAELAEGLTVLDAADESWGFDAAFKKDGHVVYFESRVGALKPELYREVWPDDPPYEMDARFVDENGETFAIRRGGDAFVDPTWVPELKQATARRTRHPDPELRAISFQLAEEMSRVMHTDLGAKIPKAFAHHISHALSMGRLVVPKVDLNELAMKRAELAQKIATKEEGFTNDGMSNYYYGQLYGGTVLYVPFYPSVCSQLDNLPTPSCGSQQETWHSAVRAWNYASNGTWNMYVDGCNHGRCPYDNMSYGNGRWSKAGWLAGGNMVDVLSYDALNADNVGTAVTGGCGTSYNWNSGSGSHLCNDDTAFEFYQIDRGVNLSYCNGAGPTAAGAHDINNFTWQLPYTSYYTFSCTPNDSWATYQCNGVSVYRDWLAPCVF